MIRYILAFPLVFISGLLPTPTPMGSNQLFAQLVVGLTASVVPTWKVGVCPPVRATVRSGRLTAALRSVFLGGEGPRGTTVFGLSLSPSG